MITWLGFLPRIGPGMFAALRWIIGLLLVWAALSKLANPSEFLGSIYAYQLPFPVFFAKCIAMGLPWIELLCGLLLCANFWPETALVCAGVLIGIFLLATLQAWVRGLRISCGCFNLAVIGLDSHSSTAKVLDSVGFAVARNFVLLLITLTLLAAIVNVSSRQSSRYSRVP